MNKKIPGSKFLLVLLGLGLWQKVYAEPRYPITVRGGDEASFQPREIKPGVIKEKAPYDAIVIGGGLAGLTAAVYLTDNGQKVLLLEKEDKVGGLAFGGATQKGIGFNRGAAYWTAAYEEEAKILERIGLANYKELHPIHEPIDSYLWKGELYEGIWEEKTLEKLPASFALFKHELKLADKAKLIPNQPIEEAPDLALDAFNAAEWIRKMPSQTASRQDEESKKIYERFLKDSKVNRADPMGDVIELMDIFCRSAQGTTAEHISAAAFANFYISEIETRYTTPIGTGQAAVNLEKILRGRKKLAKIKVQAPVKKILSKPESIEVTYIQKGRARQAEARYAIFAAQLKFAPKIIEGLAEKDAEKAQLLQDLAYTHFSIHVIFVKGHPYRASYDTWVRQADYTEDEPTDVILGRWMDPEIKGYEGMRDFKKDPKDDKGILTVYHPLSMNLVGKGYTKDQAIEIAKSGVERIAGILAPLLDKRWGAKLDIISVETNRWPYSIHIVAPGHFTRKAKILRKPFGRVFFANNNIGTPAFEEALFRGHCAANNILLRARPGFAQEPWSRCPAEN